MTHLEKFKELCDSLEIKYETDVETNRTMSIILSDKCPKFTGYGGFFSYFVFDKDGNFLSHGAGE